MMELTFALTQCELLKPAGIAIYGEAISMRGV